MPTAHELRQRITAEIIAVLESNQLPPWRRPWCSHPNSGLPTNAVSNRRYTGINPILLQLAAARHGFTSRFWATFNQWQSLGLRVMPRPKDVPQGQWGASVIYYKPCMKKEVDGDTDEEQEASFHLLKNYFVFNADQVEGADVEQFQVDSSTPADHAVDFAPAEEAIMATDADIRFGGDVARYIRLMPNGGGDYIEVPRKSDFTERREYYATMFHELAHWSEHRTNWTGSYAEGELRAEIAACFMLSELGVPQSDDLTNHHAYLADWLKALRNDPKFIFSCSSAATKAADLVLSFSRREREPVIVV